MSPYLALLPWAAIPILIVVGELRANPPKIRQDFVVNAVLILAPVAIAIIGLGRYAGVIA